MDDTTETETKSVKELDNERRDELWRLMEGVEGDVKPAGKLWVSDGRSHARPQKTLKRVFEDLNLDAENKPEPRESGKARNSITIKHHREILTAHIEPGTYEEIEDDLIKALMFLKEHSRRYLKLGNCVDLSLSLSRPERAK